MSSHTHNSVSFLASGAIHLTGIGIVWVGLGWGGYVPPAFEVPWGEMNSSITSNWAPEAQAPVDDGLLLTVLGQEDAALTQVEFVRNPAANETIRSQPVEFPVEAPTPLEHRESDDELKARLDAQVVSLATPVRLDEPPLAEPVAPPVVKKSTPPTVVSTVTAPTVSKPQVAAVSIEAPPTPENIDRPAPAKPTSPLPSKPVANVANDDKPPMKIVPGARTGNEEPAQRMGQATGTAEQGQNSRASTANASSELPPGAKADQLPLKLASNAAPKYPDEAYRQGQEGTVTLLVTVSDKGFVTAAKVVRSSGFSLLDAAALSTVESWKFTPATYQGRNVTVRVAIPVRFNLADVIGN